MIALKKEEMKKGMKTGMKEGMRKGMRKGISSMDEIGKFIRFCFVFPTFDFKCEFFLFR